MPGIPLKGADTLRRHIDSLDLSVAEWSESKGLDGNLVHRLLHGDRQRVSVETAHDIQKATNGAVQWHEWIPAPELRKDLRKRRRVAAKRRHQKRRAEIAAE